LRWRGRRFQLGTNRSSRDVVGPVNATRLSSTQTYPAGSMWTRNPIPACKGPGFGNLTIGEAQRGGSNQTAFPNTGGAVPCSHASYEGGFWYNETSQQGPQFTPPGGSWPGPIEEEHPGLYFYGFGNNHNQNGHGRKSGDFLFSIIDLVQVPEGLALGEDYVLSFRCVCSELAESVRR
jgi:hypothetical protein